MYVCARVCMDTIFRSRFREPGINRFELFEKQLILIDKEMC